MPCRKTKTKLTHAESYTPNAQPFGSMRLRGGAESGVRAISAGLLSPENPALIKVLTYDYVPDILDKRGPYRAGHIGGAKKLEESGNLIMAGMCVSCVHTLYVGVYVCARMYMCV